MVVIMKRVAARSTSLVTVGLKIPERLDNASVGGQNRPTAGSPSGR
jgi:hypothetical protein